MHISPFFRRFLEAAFIAIAFVAPAKAALVVDFSPDTTGASLNQAYWTNQYGSQVVGDRFTLANGVTLTGGSIFSAAAFGSLGDSVRFMIFTDPTASAMIDITTTLDAVDTQLTSSIASLTRKHVSIADTFLAAGDYWFALAGNGQSQVQASGSYDDGSLNFGPTTPRFTCSNCGDAFFTLDGQQNNVPEPGTIALFGLGLVGMYVRRRNKA